MRLALAVSEFPSASQTFVLDHAIGLMERGHAVELHAEARGRQMHLSDALVSKVRYSPRRVKASPAIELAGLLLRQWRQWGQHPRTTWRVLQTGGGRAERLRHCLTLMAGGKRYDVVHAHSGYNGQRLLPLYSAGYLSAPLVVTFHGHDVHAYLESKSRDHYQVLFQRAAALVVCSELMERRLCALGAPESKLHRIPNGISLKQLPCVLRDPPQRRPLRWLAVGRLVPFKGFDLLLSALGLPVWRQREWRLDLIGDGPERAALMAQAGQLGIADRVVFHGSASREVVRAHLQSSDAFVSPVIVDARGNTETQGVAVLEAMASGIPIIASDAGALPETLGGTAVALVPTGRPEQLAMAMVDCWSDPRRLRQQVEAARRRIEQHYSASTWLDRLEQLYRDVRLSSVPGQTSR